MKRIGIICVTIMLLLTCTLGPVVKAEACTFSSGTGYYYRYTSGYSYLNADNHIRTDCFVYFCNVCHQVCEEHVPIIEGHSYTISGNQLWCICGDHYGY